MALRDRFRQGNTATPGIAGSTPLRSKFKLNRTYLLITAGALGLIGVTILIISFAMTPGNGDFEAESMTVQPGIVNPTDPTPTPTPPIDPTTTPSTVAFAPTGLTTTAVADKSITLDWADSTDPAFAYYTVKRSIQPEPSTGTWVTVADHLATSNLADTSADLVPGTTYYYYATTTNTSNVVSNPSTVVSATTKQPTVPLSLQLYNADTDVAIGSVTNGQAINLSTTGRITVAAQPGSSVGSMAFYVNGTLAHTDNVAPYTVAGNIYGTDLNTWNVPAGSYKLEAKAYAGANATSTLIGSTTVNVTLSGAPASPVAKPLINETFDTSEPFVISGGQWNPSLSNIVVGSPQNDGGTAAIPNIATHPKRLVGDFTASAIITVVKNTESSQVSDEASLIFGYQSSDDYYYVNLAVTNTAKTSGVFHCQDGICTQIADIASYNLKYATQTFVSVTRTGNKLGIGFADAPNGVPPATYAGINVAYDGPLESRVGIGTQHSIAAFDSFTVSGTLASSVPDTVKPAVSIPPTGGSYSGTMKVQTVAADNVGINKVTYTFDGAAGGTDYSAPFEMIRNTLNNTPDGVHTITATAYDSVGNTTTTTTQIMINNSSSSNTSGLQAPTNLHGTLNDGDYVRFAWTAPPAPTNGLQFVAYDIYGQSYAADGTPDGYRYYGAVTSLDSGNLVVMGSTHYSFRVIARYSNNIQGPASAELHIATAKYVDKESPTASTILSTYYVSPTQVNIMFTPARDNVGVSYYGVIVDDVEQTLRTTPNLAANGEFRVPADPQCPTCLLYGVGYVIPSRSHSYKIRAYDANGNFTDSTADLTAPYTGTSAGGPIPNNVPVFDYSTSNPNCGIAIENAKTSMSTLIPDYYGKMLRYISRIECRNRDANFPPNSGGYTQVWSNPPYIVLALDSVVDLPWNVSVLAHETTHASRYFEYLADNPTATSVPNCVYLHQAACGIDYVYQAHLDVLVRIGAPQNEIDYLRQLYVQQSSD